MTLDNDFDPVLARRLEQDLAPYAPVGRISSPRAPRPARRRLVLGAALAAILAAGLVGLGYEINASAESQGLACLHPIAKVQLYAQGLTGHDGDHGSRQTHDERTQHDACHP
jgi:fatty acid desaturase